MSEHEEPRARFRPRRPAVLALAGAGLLALGVAGGAGVMAQTRPSISMAPAVPVAVRSLTAGGIVTVRGRVAEVYGNKFVLDDGTGRALVDTGPEGDRRALVTVGTSVTVQGRFGRGFVHAAFLVGPDARVQALGPLTGPPREPHDGPDRGPGGAPPPPVPEGKAPPPPPPPPPSTSTAAIAPAPAPSPVATRAR